ncbi:MAG: DNA-3-methyladenine glycosylase 2 family protein [Candidatus Sungbacteria bacterium]|nr:DNA-3-methyladenine glycosylase 2 family protein [Candidatus Sungbacteria bacterium]
MISTSKIEKVKEHFRSRDGKIFSVLEGMGLEALMPQEDPGRYFAKLCREIIGQQLAGRAADAIAGRFVKLFPKATPTPRRVMACSEDALRRTGMSWAKVRSVRDLALKTAKGELAFEKFSQLDDEAVIAELAKVRGIGRWTAEMFLVFTLGREDVFSHGDLGLRKGLVRLYGKSRTRTREHVGRIAAAWSPYRSYACLALWHINDSQK